MCPFPTLPPILPLFYPGRGRIQRSGATQNKRGPQLGQSIQFSGTHLLCTQELIRATRALLLPNRRKTCTSTQFCFCHVKLQILGIPVAESKIQSSRKRAFLSISQVESYESSLSRKAGFSLLIDKLYESRNVMQCPIALFQLDKWLMVGRAQIFACHWLLCFPFSLIILRQSSVHVWHAFGQLSQTKEFMYKGFLC